MTLRVLVDESLPRSVGAALSAIGVVSGADDLHFFAYAQQEMLASRDVAFADIVVARVPSKRPLAALAGAFVRALSGLEPADLHGAVFIIDEHRVRIRRAAP